VPGKKEEKLDGSGKGASSSLWKGEKNVTVWDSRRKRKRLVRGGGKEVVLGN